MGAFVPTIAAWFVLSAGSVRSCRRSADPAGLLPLFGTSPSPASPSWFAWLRSALVVATTEGDTDADRRPRVA